MRIREVATVNTVLVDLEKLVDPKAANLRHLIVLRKLDSPILFKVFSPMSISFKESLHQRRR